MESWICSCLPIHSSLLNQYQLCLLRLKGRTELYNSDSANFKHVSILRSPTEIIKITPVSFRSLVIINTVNVSKTYHHLLFTSLISNLSFCRCNSILVNWTTIRHDIKCKWITLQILFQFYFHWIWTRGSQYQKLANIFRSSLLHCQTAWMNMNQNSSLFSTGAALTVSMGQAVPFCWKRWIWINC